MKWNLLALLIFVSFFTPGQQSDLCSWIEDDHDWGNGMKAILNLQLHQDYDNWTVTWTFDQNIISLESWKGDVKVNSLKSTCIF